MRTTILALVMLFIAGCVQYKYEHLVYDDNNLKEVIRVSGSKAMVNDSKAALTAEFPDGAKLNVGAIETIADPNSAIAIGEAIGTGAKAFVK